jgi:hypothetical protein
MFAHGEANLRTKEMNLADKLTTEDAIRNFQQVLRGDASEARTTTPTPVAKLLTVVDVDMPPSSPTSTAPPTPKNAAPKGQRFLAALCAPAMDPAALAEVAQEFAPTPTKGQIKSTPYMPEGERPSSPSSTNASVLRTHSSEISDCIATCAMPFFAMPFSRATSPGAMSAGTSPSASPSKRYRHDPYAPVVLTPQASRQTSPQPSPRSNALPSSADYFAPSPAPCLCVDCLVASGAVTPVVSPSSARAQSPALGAFVSPRVGLSALNPRASTYCPPPKSTYCAALVDPRQEILLA